MKGVTAENSPRVLLDAAFGVGERFPEFFQFSPVRAFLLVYPFRMERL